MAVIGFYSGRSIGLPSTLFVLSECMSHPNLVSVQIVGGIQRNGCEKETFSGYFTIANGSYSGKLFVCQSSYHFIILEKA